MTQLSIQGEREQAKAVRAVADQGTVEDYARNCSPGVATCRWRGRHRYTAAVEYAGLDFDRVREDGLLEREDTCDDCGCAVQIQLWEAYEITIAGKKIPQVRFLVAYVIYQKNEHGEEYLLKGHGTMSTKAFRQAWASQQLSSNAQNMVREALRVTRSNKRKAKK